VMIRVDSTLALPIYEQIREQVLRMVLAGTLASGTRMPTIRQLANDLQLARGTVAKAYSLLETHKVLETRGHKGTFITDALASTGISETDSAAALAGAADAYVVVALQLGTDRDAAIREFQNRWDQVT